MSYGGFLRANTETTRKLGPFIDSTDGNTEETGLAIAQADIRLSKNGGDFAQINHNQGGGNLTHDELGYYNFTMNATDLNTEGHLKVAVHESGALLVEIDFIVLSEAAWDSLMVAKDDGYMDVNIKTIGRADTQETEANNLESACSNYSATRGLAGTALPAAAADAAGGLPISDAGGLDLDTILARITEARMGALTDWIDGGRLDLLLDALLARLTTTRAGYLDNLSAGAVAQQSSVDDLEGRLTATRAGYLDNLATAPPAASAIADAVHDEVVEGTLTLRGMARLFMSVLAGELTITDNEDGTHTYVFRDVADSKARITVVVNDTTGNRTSVTVDAT